MGVSASTLTADLKKQQDEIPVPGHFVSDIKTGYRWATDPIISGPDVVKKPLGNTIPQFENNNNLKYVYSLPKLPGEVWGPYRKKFTKSSLGGQMFAPAESIDGIPILCRCREIAKYMRDDKGGRMLQGFGAVVFGKNPPMCWDDNESIFDPTGGMYYYVQTRNPLFYEYAYSSQGSYGVAKSILTGPVGPVPLALGAYYLMKPSGKGQAAPAEAVTAPAASAPAPTVGGKRNKALTRRRRSAVKKTKKLKRYASRNKDIQH